MWTAKWILDAYEEGDDTTRWELYMTYRDLRSCFDEMEGRLDTAGKKVLSRADKKPRGTRWNPCTRLVKGKMPV